MHDQGCASLCDMKKHTTVQTKTVRRSVALPRKLVEEVAALATPAERSNWNRLVVVALEEYANRKRRTKLDEAMAAMAADPAARTEMKAIEKQFRKTERDGLD